MNAESEKSFEFRDVSFRLPGGKTLLSDLNLKVDRGETLVLLGRSGSGKTTTMKLINRLLDPTEGEVKVLAEFGVSAHANHGIEEEGNCLRPSASRLRPGGALPLSVIVGALGRAGISSRPGFKKQRTRRMTSPMP